MKQVLIGLIVILIYSVCSVNKTTAQIPPNIPFMVYPDTVCQYEPVFIRGRATGTNLYNGTLEFRALWDLGDGTIDSNWSETILGSTKIFYTHTYVNTGLFQVIACAKNDWGIDCDTIEIYVRPGINADFTYSTVKLDEVVSFTNLSVGPGTHTFEWDFGDGWKSTDENPVHTFVYPDTFYVILTVTNGECVGVKTDTIIVEIDSSMLTDISWVAACPCNKIQFYANGAATDWEWDFGNGDIATEQNPLYTYKKPGTYFVSATGKGTCPSCVFTIRKAITICGQNIIETHSNDKWFFGNNAGIDFSSGSPVEIFGSGLISNESAATVSNSVTGALLFYTNGETIWNQNHLPMDNGSGLKGSQSSQVLIMPYPGNRDRYYVFTSNGLTGTAIGYYYSVVDMTVNGGLGQVIIKDASLFVNPCAPNGNIKHEGITGTLLSNNSGCPDDNEYWVVIPSCLDSFMAFKLTASGIASPVVSIFNGSQISSSHQQYNIVGQCAFSPDGRKIAVIEGTNNLLSRIRVFDFDLQMGILSKPISINVENMTERNYPKGVNFSPDNSKMYIKYNDLTYGNPNSMYQYNMESMNFVKDRFRIGSNSTGGYMFAGPDEKMYAPNGNFLTIINDPNSLDVASGFTANGFSLTNNSNLMLQNLVSLENYDTLRADFSFDSTLCPSLTISFFNVSAECFFQPDSILATWDYGDGIIENFPSIQYPTHTYSEPGDYIVSLILSKGCYVSDTFVQTVHIDTVPLIQFFADSVCAGDTIRLVSSIQYLDTSIIKYNWGAPINDTFANANYIFTVGGNYNIVLTVSDTSNCQYTYADTVFIKDIPDVDVSPTDTTICENATVILTASLSGEQIDGGSIIYLWTPANNFNNNTISNPIANPVLDTKYSVLVTNQCGTDTATVTVNVESCNIYIPNAFSPNNDGENDIFRIIGTGIKAIEINIYDRWGHKIFETTDINQGWDGFVYRGFGIGGKGKLAPQGVYVYYLNIDFVDGGNKTARGNINLLR